jgi:DNA-binding response OmpR family regulator
MAIRVILIEDSPAVKRAIRMSLLPPDFELLVFDGVRQFLDKTNQMKPDIALLSCSLAMKSDPQSLKDWNRQKASRKTAVVLLRKVFEPIDHEKVAGLDRDALLEIPFDSARLVSLTKDLIEKREDPPSLPEEHLLDDLSAQGKGENLEERVKALIKQETLEMERALEKRMRTQLLAEIKDWLLERLDDMKKEEKGEA